MDGKSWHTCAMEQNHTHWIKNQQAYRGIAALWVFLGHLLYAKVYDAGFARVEDWGILGKAVLLRFQAVDGFFILSGCLLAQFYWDHFTKETTGKQIDRFYLKRICRLFPLYLLGIALIGGYELLGVPHPISSGLESVIFQHWEWTLILNLTGMMAWGIVPVSSWNEPTWTVSAIILAYILFPNLVLLLRRIPERVYPVLIVGLLAAYYLFRTLLDLGSNSDGVGAIARVLVFFIIGMMLARLQQAQWQSCRNWDAIILWCLGLFAAGMTLWWQWFAFDLLPFQLITVLLVYALMQANGIVAGWYANRLFCWLGAISYALLIVHYPVLLALKAAYGEPLLQLAQSGIWGMVAAYALTFTAVLSAAWMAHRWIELPADRWLRRQLKD